MLIHISFVSFGFWLFHACDEFKLHNTYQGLLEVANMINGHIKKIDVMNNYHKYQKIILISLSVINCWDNECKDSNHKIKNGVLKWNLSLSLL